jgi:hypothetical protein
MMISPKKLFLFSPTLSIDAPSSIEKTKIFDSTTKLFSISTHTQHSIGHLRRRAHCRRKRETQKEKPPVEPLRAIQKRPKFEIRIVLNPRSNKTKPRIIVFQIRDNMHLQTLVFFKSG